MLLGPLLVLTAAQPAIPIGYDAYARWDLWPMQRIGMRAYMRSTYDRNGGNRGADASHFLYEEGGLYYPLDVRGAGVLAFARFNHWHGSPWTFEVDRRAFTVAESSTAHPDRPVEGSTFLPAAAFPEPFAFTWSRTRGADLSWVPIPFQRTLRIGYGRTNYGTGYFIVHQFAPGTPLSRPLTSWTPQQRPPETIRRMIDRSGEDSQIDPRWKAVSGRVDLRPAMPTVFCKLSGSQTVRLIQFDVPENQAAALELCRLSVTWDGRASPSLDAPVPLFFGAGTLFNRASAEWLVKAFPVSVRQRNGFVRLRCLFPMPFFRSAEMRLVGNAAVKGLRWSVRSVPFLGDPRQFAYFHASYRDHGPSPTRGVDLTLLDTAQQEGSREWSGSFVGTSIVFSDRADLETLEGDPRFFFDDSETPQAQGTGTEEWCGGGDYWGGQTMTLPFAGHPVGASDRPSAVNARDQVESAYRYLLGDLMPFGKRAVIRLEHGGTDESKEHYRTIAYWYGLPAASLVLTDRLDLGSAKSERLHKYQPRGQTETYRLSSRYEWGVDTLKKLVVYPATSATVRSAGGSEFLLKLQRNNSGVLLRRTLDYGVPNQRAVVYVSSAEGSPKWRKAGTWYLAGSSTYVYSNPPGELAAAMPRPESSNRRFRDDEFLIGRALTSGHSSIRVRIVALPVDRAVMTGQPAPSSLWTEIRYMAYCFVEPHFKQGPT